MIPDFWHDLPLLYAGGNGARYGTIIRGRDGRPSVPRSSGAADLQVNGPVARTPGVFSTVDSQNSLVFVDAIVDRPNRVRAEISAATLNQRGGTTT